MRLPEPDGVMRITTSSVKPNQRLLSLASIRPAASSAATIVHPIFRAVSSARLNAAVGGKARVKGTIAGIGLPLLLGDPGTLIGHRIGACGSRAMAPQQ